MLKCIFSHNYYSNREVVKRMNWAGDLELCVVYVCRDCGKFKTRFVENIKTKDSHGYRWWFELVDWKK